MATATKTSTKNTGAAPATDEAVELAKLLRRLTDAAERVDWTCCVPSPSSAAVATARDRLAALGERLSDARRKADTLRGEIADAESRVRNLDEQAAAVADGADPAEATKSVRAKRDELADVEHACKVLDRAITRERETLRRAVLAESGDAAAVVRPTFSAAVQVHCLAIQAARAVGPLVMRLHRAFQAAGYTLGEHGLPDLLPMFELQPMEIIDMPDGSTVCNKRPVDMYLEHVKQRGIEL